ncbi:MAG: transposase [Muribaculaceae bacterium]|nr:transposase [Muribaculaceae bacterium]
MKCENYKEDFIHSYCRRKRGHDYYSPCRYHIILKKQPGFERFGRIVGDANIPPGNVGAAEMEWNKYGKAINHALFNLSHQFPFLKVYQHMVMPDHVHIFLQVKERSEKHLGYYIGQLKGNIAKNISSQDKREILGEEIFQPNYTDKIIYWGRDFDIIYQYIRENPHRLAMRIQYPEFFKRIDEIKIGDKTYSIYGNHFLLQNPFKSQVVIHRRNSVEENEKLEYEWLRIAEGGGVLVSPFISMAEKRIRDLAEKEGGKFILIQSEPFSELFKPAKHNFDLCSDGKLLIIAPNEAWSGSFREVCLEMNKLAEEISGRDFRTSSSHG